MPQFRVRLTEPTNSRQCRMNAPDHQIDQLVHQLYGLTDAEIRLVEEATR